MIHWNRVQIAKEEIASKSHDFSRVKPFKISEKKGEKISPKNKTQGKKERLENFLRVSVLWFLIHSGLIRSPKSLAQYFCKGSRSRFRLKKIEPEPGSFLTGWSIKDLCFFGSFERKFYLVWGFMIEFW